MPRRNKIESERLHDRLLGAFREVPDPSSSAATRYAAEKANCSRSIARRALEVGLGKGLRSIRDLLSEEKLLTRASLRREQLAEQVEAATEDAKLDAIESRKRQGRLITRGQEALSQLLDGFLTAHLKKFGEQIAAGQVQELSMPELVATLRSLTGSARELQAMENLLLGDPTSIIGGEVTIAPQVADVTVAEAARELELAQRALTELAEANESTDPGRAIARNGHGSAVH